MTDNDVKLEVADLLDETADLLLDYGCSTSGTVDAAGRLCIWQALARAVAQRLPDRTWTWGRLVDVTGRLRHEDANTGVSAAVWVDVRQWPWLLLACEQVRSIATPKQYDMMARPHQLVVPDRLRRIAKDMRAEVHGG